MQKLGTALIISGIFLLGLAGLEKVLLFLAVTIKAPSNRMDAVINLTPTYIWNVTTATFWGGLLLTICGFLLYFSRTNPTAN